MTEPLVKVEDLSIEFDVSKRFLNRLLSNEPKSYLKAVKNVSFEINRGESFSIVGESGCGKSTIARLLVGLYKPTSGRIIYDGIDLAMATKAERDMIRRKSQMIFQDPFASLNPRWTVERIVAEPLHAFGLVNTASEARKKVAKMLGYVGLGASDMAKYPHEFSGGQRQRISIARALAGKPEFLVCDEPTSALDVSVQAQIINLMKDLQDEFDLTYLFISHDMSVISHFSDRVGVMYLGNLVESGPVDRIFDHPQHRYTTMLMDSIPDISQINRARTPVSGEVPNPINPPSGCPFHPRCNNVTVACKQSFPTKRTIAKEHIVHCEYQAV
ncbi:MAG: ABC transporter ATP-binding protein [Photobacterium sp.]|nr:ABC transporter ATP-binding protein [Photobacterium sp.]MDX1301041.1 ABC transporter ATP-binding protein [Photobacterium sp.]